MSDTEMIQGSHDEMAEDFEFISALETNSKGARKSTNLVRTFDDLDDDMNTHKRDTRETEMNISRNPVKSSMFEDDSEDSDDVKKMQDHTIDLDDKSIAKSPEISPRESRESIRIKNP